MNATPWGRSQSSVVGQLIEWEVWVELVVHSHGRLHVFLPLLDRGVDALVHRIDDVRWIPVQVERRSKLRNASMEVDQIREPYRGHLRFPDAPRSGRPGRLDPYRRPLNRLGGIVAELTRA